MGMTDIHLGLKRALPDAMRAKDTNRLNVIRGLMTAFTNELVATGSTPQNTLDDVLCGKVILRTIKQRQDAIEQFQKANRQDLADEDKIQLGILQEFAPEMASLDEVKKIADSLKLSMGIEDKTKMGMLIGAVKKELGDRGDGAVIKKVVEDLFI
jgi:uncharacterized protein YqeY